MATLPQGRNGVPDFIPVARIADMLLNPGTPYRYNGETCTYPDIRLVYWAGGNPFHHHQDLNRLRRAIAREIGRAHVLTPVTNAHLVCRLLLEKKKQTHYNNTITQQS